MWNINILLIKYENSDTIISFIIFISWVNDSDALKYHRILKHNFIGTNPPGFSGRPLTTIYKSNEFALRIADQIIQKLNF